MGIKIPEGVTGKTDQRRFGAALWEAFRIAVESIWTHKMRSILTLLGIIIGVASVVTVGGAINGLSTTVEDEISSTFASNTFNVARIARTNISEEDWEQIIKRNKNLKREDLEAVMEKCESCQAISPRMQRTADVKRGSRALYDASVRGVSEDMPKIQTLDIDAGRFFSGFDVSHARQFAVIGADVREEIFGTGEALGKVVKLGSDNYTVIGVEKKSGSMMGQSLDRNVYIPYTVFLKRYGTRQSIQFQVRAASDETLAATMDEVRQILRTRHKLRPNREDDFDILASAAIQEFVGQILGLVAAVIMPITLISLLVGGIVVMNIMLVTVTERTVEIGMRKAVGAKRSDILLQFLVESALLATLGGAIGILIAYGLGAIVTVAAGVPMSISIGYIVMALAASGGIGIISGLYPAYKASKLSPIVALAKE
ncbi:MAG: ABC transporter permease [Acidobacteriota bacterium]|jgi:putative ABC transport system permease protein|nr:ABC transporter permease [Acidobacteriota bacterium]